MLIALLLAGAAICLPIHGLDLWTTEDDYLDFAAMKSCLGFDTAVRLEKKTYDIAVICEKNIKRIIKASQPAREETMLCNLQGLNLMKSDLSMNYDTIPSYIEESDLNPELKDAMTEKTSFCMKHAEQVMERVEGSILKTQRQRLVLGMIYLQCIISEGMDVCQEHEAQRIGPLF
ncbi:uncharacterized protein LOC121856611 isoform X2 [Homarus americanus]|uniref:uncharacterized protein LOC121856611 isoform X2 n=1 Tax=Homarus americanus TaxID=6706 RepID=UPI001C48A295|nr:uncharacterized protein LOC121856611 isoform X2 [Homarus americanus]